MRKAVLLLLTVNRYCFQLFYGFCRFLFYFAAMRVPVSVVIITHNEALRISPVLAAVSWADEIVVVDSGSSDATVEICLKAGARVVQQDFSGFGQQKQLGVDRAQHDWILSLDADEVLSVETAAHVRQLLEKGPDRQAYFIRRQLIFLNKKFRFGRESRDYQLRFFNRRMARWNEKQVHEGLEFSGKAGVLKGRVDHYSYPDLASYLAKFNRYTDLAAAGLVSGNKSRSPCLLALSFPWNLFKIYWLDGNFLNGFAGFIWSVLSSAYPLVKYAKAIEKRAGFVKAQQ
jgi:glycosyltransferase involved in cell wall biosynthesis